MFNAIIITITITPVQQKNCYRDQKHFCTVNVSALDICGSKVNVLTPKLGGLHLNVTHTYFSLYKLTTNVFFPPVIFFRRSTLSISFYIGSQLNASKGSAVFCFCVNWQMLTL